MSTAATGIVYIEDDDALRDATVRALELEGFAVTAFAEAQGALRLIDAGFGGVVVSDVRLPGLDGIGLFAQLRELDPEMQIIFTTAHGDVALAVEAMKGGAADFFTKPFAVDRLVDAIERAAQRRALVLENRRLRDEIRSRSRTELLGSSPAAERLGRIVGEVARADIDLLVEGPPGSGKSFVAQQIHQLGPRADRPLVTIDPAIFASEDADLILFGRDPSAALSRSGMIERAQGGTLVVEDIANLPPRAQTQLASLLETRSFLPLGADRPRPIDIRVIATGSQTAAPDNAEGSAGRGLLHRLGGMTVTLPRLADRREDIPELFRHFVRQFESELGENAHDLGEPEWRRLLTHDWPGNIRELRMFARNFVLGLTRVAQPELEHAGQRGLREMMSEFERSLLVDELRRERGSVEQVRRNLALPRKTLYDKFARYNLRPQDYR